MPLTGRAAKAGWRSTCGQSKYVFLFLAVVCVALLTNERARPRSVLFARDIGMPQFQGRAWIIIEEQVGVRNEVIFVPAELRLGLISALLLKPDRKAHIVP